MHTKLPVRPVPTTQRSVELIGKLTGRFINQVPDYCTGVPTIVKQKIVIFRNVCAMLDPVSQYRSSSVVNRNRLDTDPAPNTRFFFDSIPYSDHTRHQC